MLPSRCIVSKPSGWICRACLASVSLPLVPQRRTFASKKQSRKPDQLLPSSAARTRFAPSPTGYLHLGSLRTALFNYLLAKATGGQFLLRIEDTDTKRTVPGAAQRIFDDLRWAGLQWDEGPEVGGPYGPYYQSQRGEIYREHGAELLKTGHAYRCFCSAERLDELARARAALGLPTDYDRSCLSIPEEEAADRACKGESHTIRLKVPDIYRGYKDVVYGKVGTPKQKKMIHGEPSYEDPVLVKSDGQPTYHLANVVDDHLMEITHVIRGVEWMPSTFKHIAMYEAFGWTPPEFAHVGLLQDKDGQKLSKRKMDIDIDSYRNNGIFPEALVNHVALLGWSHQEKTDFLPIQRLIEIFDMKFTKGNTIVNFPKMTHLQKWYAQRFIDTDEKDTDLFKRKLSGMVDSVLSVVKRQGESVENLYVPPNKLPTESDHDEHGYSGESANIRSYIADVIKADAKQYASATDFYERNKNFFKKSNDMDMLPCPEDVAYWSTCNLHEILELGNRATWDQEELKKSIHVMVERFIASNKPDHLVLTQGTKDNHQAIEGLKKSLSRYLRWALMNSRPGPPIALTMELLGREETTRRIRHAQLQVPPFSSGGVPEPEAAAAA